MVFFIFKRLRSGMVSLPKSKELPLSCKVYADGGNTQQCLRRRRKYAAMSTPTSEIRSNVYACGKFAAMELAKQNARLARSRAFCYARETNVESVAAENRQPNGETLTKSLDDQGADCEQRHGDYDRRKRRKGKLLLPPVGGGAGSLGQRGHDALLDANWSHAAAKHLALGVDPGPELDLRLAFDFAGAHYVDLTIEPVVQQSVTRRSVERNLAVVERLGGLVLSLSGLAARNLFVSLETSVIKHHAYFSSSSCWSASRARCTRIFSAPTVVSSNSAISSYDLPSTCFMTNASRSEGASLARANCKSVRSSLRSISSSGVEYVEG